jgi:hypothetical protein
MTKVFSEPGQGDKENFLQISNKATKSNFAPLNAVRVR